MLTRYDPPEFLARLQARRTAFYPEVEATVRQIIARVREQGDAALYELTAQFDRCDLRATGLQVTPAEFAAARTAVSQAFKDAVAMAVDNITSFHKPQVPNSWFQTRPDGSILGQRVTAVDVAGIYVAGGTAPLFSCLLMTVIPARVAGCRQVIVCTPPGPDGRIDPHMLYAAEAAGADAVYKVGGAQAVAAMAYGTATIPRVDKIAGPGNYYVTLAKKLVYGPVGVDMLAGPTEVVVIDDGTSNPAWLAADLLSQAEHPNGMCILVTTAAAMVDRVNAEIERQTALLPRAATVRQSLTELGAALVVPDLAAAARLADAIAPEHLALSVAEPWALLPQVTQAGAVFLGHFTPEPIGDYIAGPSNVIPTEGTPRYASQVSVETFLKRSSVVAYSEAAFRAQAPHAITLAELERLEAHAASLRIRLT
jgi:histidinol dehydrogenase